MNNTYDNVTDEDIIAILIEHDPIGLQSIGAPLDEYMSEAHAIRHRLVDDFSFQTILILVYSVFVFYFDPILAGHVNNYISITKKIMALKKKPETKISPQLKLVVSN